MKVFTEVTVGGPLSNNKGINKLGGGLSAEALTEKDKADIATAAKINVDYLAVSFPRTGKISTTLAVWPATLAVTPKLLPKLNALKRSQPMKPLTTLF